MGYDIEKEKREAIEAGQRALSSLRTAKENLNSAKNWGLVDMFGGGFSIMQFHGCFQKRFLLCKCNKGYQMLCVHQKSPPYTRILPCCTFQPVTIVPVRQQKSNTVSVDFRRT